MIGTVVSFSIFLLSVTTLVRFAFYLDYVKGLTGFLDFVVSEVPPVADGVPALLTTGEILSYLV